MDQTQLQQKIALYYSKLPENLQQFFVGMNWINTLQEISVENNLNDEQIKTLSTETTLALLCVIPMSDYVKTIESELKISKEQTDQLLLKINEKIFKDIGYQLEETFIKNANNLTEEKYGGDKKLDERFANLPKEVQFAINESGYQTTLYSIASKYKLSIEQMGTLEEATTKVMLNILHPDQYENELFSGIKISREDISSLVKDVNEEIFKTIRELLKSNWDNNMVIKKETEEVPIPPYKKIIKEEGINNTNINKEIISKTEQPKTIEPIKTIAESPVEIQTPKEAVQEILKTVAPIKTIDEKKPAMVIHNIFEDKLKEPTTSKHSVSNYSIPDSTKSTPKISEIIEKNTVKISTSTDPYREAF